MNGPIETKKIVKDLKKSVAVFHSDDIFGKSGKLVLIKHADSFYRLMITRQDKLILTK